jgi:hypothetical protein
MEIPPETQAELSNKNSISEDVESNYSCRGIVVNAGAAPGAIHFDISVSWKTGEWRWAGCVND